jgi:enamine deaminase RidA (YjgF/YER057c/UK114 family)
MSVVKFFPMRVLCIVFLICVSICASAQDAEKKLKDLKIELLKPAAPIGTYTKAVRVGNLIFLSGHGPLKADGTYMTGKVGKDATLEQAFIAARQTAISMLSTLKAELGDLNKVKRVVKVLGMVNCTEGFTDQPKVMNGFSDLMVSVYGEKGIHARSAVGVISLPGNMMVEIEMIVEVSE